MTKLFNQVFDKCIEDYHIQDSVDSPINNPYPANELSHLLYAKCQIDTVQWHLEDIIRRENIDPSIALGIKRRIDRSNQDRTDMVEYIDSYYLNLFKDIKTVNSATINTESPAWAIDRLSILALKIYHMREQVERTDASQEHIASCQSKLDVLLSQRTDLSCAIDTLLEQISRGEKYMKVYKQMKMYNDPSLNPELYGKV
ncbi:MAG: DUF4254 domain-containing protein [Flavobacteriales bacterium]|nr:DUF4254 domain-containing protein [Flavobacteriales bacterium]